MNINRAWFLFYGAQIGLSRQEILNCPYGEMMDMISCLSVYNGNAEVVEKKKPKTFDDVMSME